MPKAPVDELLEIDANEVVHVRIKKHWMGLVKILGGAIFVVVAIMGIMFASLITLPKVDTKLQGYEGYITLLAMVLIFVVVIFTALAVWIYRRNELIVTSDNIIQVLQFGLFNRQISQLNLGKIQDVSVDQIGILADLFHYGVIDIETAGEASNFHFSDAPEPNHVAKQIIEAHEEFVQRFSGGAPGSTSGGI